MYIQYKAGRHLSGQQLLATTIKKYVSQLKSMGSYTIKNLRDFSPLANYANRATAACWRSSANFCG
jgi:hypothetical protein